MLHDPKIVWDFLPHQCLERSRLACGPAGLTDRKIKVKHEQLQNMLKTGTGDDGTCQRIRMLRINDTGCSPHLSVLGSFVVSKTMGDQRQTIVQFPSAAPRVQLYALVGRFTTWRINSDATLSRILVASR